jgi:hypothetical protein
MKSHHVVRTHQPKLGLVAFVRAAAVKPQGTCVAGLGPFVPASHRWHDGSEDQVHPGEGDA